MEYSFAGGIFIGFFVGIAFTVILMLRREVGMKLWCIINLDHTSVA